MTITQPTTQEVEHYGKSAEDMLREGLFPRMHTLLSLRKAYHDVSIGIRQSVHNKFGYGERVADLVDTTGAEERPNDFLRLTYVQQPEGVLSEGENSTIKKGVINQGRKTVKGGKRIIYDCPPNGWQVPTSDGLWHPKTGAAIATVQDRSEAVRQLKTYIKAHQEQFAGFEPQNSQELAEKEVSYQWRSEANSGVRSVRRDFWHHNYSPFYVSLDADLSSQNAVVGARLR